MLLPAENVWLVIKASTVPSQGVILSLVPGKHDLVIQSVFKNTNENVSTPAFVKYN